MKKLIATNTFEKGMLKDYNELIVPKGVYTDALNATLVTFNGNENVLQNDMGNSEVKTAKLPEGYIPVGTCELGGIIYIVAYNPLKKLTLIGSFPSPLRKIETKTNVREFDVENFIENYTIEESTFMDWIVLDKSQTITLFDQDLSPGDSYEINLGSIPELLICDVVAVDKNNKTYILQNDIINYNQGLLDIAVSGKLCLLIHPNIPNNFSIEYIFYKIQGNQYILELIPSHIDIVNNPLLWAIELEHTSNSVPISEIKYLVNNNTINEEQLKIQINSTSDHQIHNLKIIPIFKDIGKIPSLSKTILFDTYYLDKNQIDILKWQYIVNSENILEIILDLNSYKLILFANLSFIEVTLEIFEKIGDIDLDTGVLIEGLSFSYTKNLNNILNGENFIQIEFEFQLNKPYLCLIEITTEQGSLYFYRIVYYSLLMDTYKDLNDYKYLYLSDIVTLEKITTAHDLQISHIKNNYYSTNKAESEKILDIYKENYSNNTIYSYDTFNLSGYVDGRVRLSTDITNGLIRLSPVREIILNINETQYIVNQNNLLLTIIDISLLFDIFTPFYVLQRYKDMVNRKVFKPLNVKTATIRSILTAATRKVKLKKLSGFFSSDNVEFLPDFDIETDLNKNYALTFPLLENINIFLLDFTPHYLSNPGDIYIVSFPLCLNEKDLFYRCVYNHGFYFGLSGTNPDRGNASEAILLAFRDKNTGDTIYIPPFSIDKIPTKIELNNKKEELLNTFLNVYKLSDDSNFQGNLWLVTSENHQDTKIPIKISFNTSTVEFTNSTIMNFLFKNNSALFWNGILNLPLQHLSKLVINNLESLYYMTEDGSNYTYAFLSEGNASSLFTKYVGNFMVEYLGKINTNTLSIENNILVMTPDNWEEMYLYSTPEFYTSSDDHDFFRVGYKITNYNLENNAPYY